MSSLPLSSLSAGSEPALTGDLLFEQLAANSPDTILILSLRERQAVFHNRDTFLGYTLTELMAPGSLVQYVHPDEAGLISDQIQRLLAGEACQVEYRLRHREGHWEWVQSRATPLRLGAAAQVDHVLFNFAVVTEHKLAEAARRASEERFRALIENSGDYVVVRAAEGHFSYLSPSARKLLGLGPAEVLTSQRLREHHLHRDDQPTLVAALAAASAQPGVRQPPIELRVLDYAGDWHALETVVVDLLANPAIQGVVISSRDITERRRAEAARRESEARYRAVVEQTSEAIFLIDGATLRIFEANEAFKRLLGYTEADLETLTLYDLVNAERASIDHNVRLTIQQGLHLIGERQHRRKDGRLLDVDVSASVITFAGREVLTAVARDITDRKQKEAALARQAAELAALYRASAQLLNPGDDLPTLAERVATALTREFAFADCGVLLVDEAAGELLRVARAGPYQVRAQAPLYLNGPGLTVAAARTGAVVYAPDVTRDPRYVPNESRTVSELVAPLRFGGRVIGVLDLQSDQPAAFDDRSLRIIAAFAERAELALANAMLVARLNDALRVAEEANRLKSEFLANTSHELRTPLTGILGALSLILNDEVQSPQEARQFAQIASDSAHNLLSIVNDLLDFARMEAGKMTVQLEPVELNALLTNLHMLMWASVTKKGLRLAMDLPPGLVWARADEEKVKQVMLNLLGNALKFTDQGEIRVLVEVEADQQRLRLSVSDTGIGIPPEKQGLLFRPFVQVDGSTTRRHGGTGLGLSISRRLAEMMGGALTLYSAGAGQGSTFTLTLPLAEDVP